MLLMAGRVDRSQNQLICPAMRESEAQPASIAAGNPLMPGKSGGGLMALGAVVLAGCLAVLAVLSFDTTEPLMLTLMAFLATLGVFFLFGLAAGHIRIAERKTDGEVVAALAKGFSDGLCVTTLEGRRLYANPAFDTLVAPAKFSHVSALETLFAGEPQAAEALFRLARAAGRNESRTEEVRLRTVVAGQRHSRWFRLGVTAVNTPLGLDETGPVVLWRITDITDERRREVETLRSLEATLGHYEAMPIGLMVTDENAGIEYINDALAHWLGLSAGALVRGLKLTDIVSGDGAVLLRAMARDASETAQRIDLDLVREDGRTWPASLIVVPRAQSGKAEGFSAVIIERADLATSEHQWDVVSTKLVTEFSNNIRNNFGFLNRAAEEGVGARDKLFVQEGRKVFKDVCPMVAELIAAHLAENQLNVSDVKRFWLHQANLNMNLLIARKLLGRDAEPHEAPVILDTYANTSSAGSVIALHKHQDDLPAGSLGVLSSFGAGYSIGSVILRKR